MVLISVNGHYGTRRTGFGQLETVRVRVNLQVLQKSIKSIKVLFKKKLSVNY